MPEHVRISQTIATFSPARFVAADRVLDRSASGPKWLEVAAIADLIVGTIQIGKHERRFYEMAAWAVMPNHVHVLILPKSSCDG